MKIFNESKEGLSNWINARLPYLYENNICPHWESDIYGNPSDQDYYISSNQKSKQQIQIKK